MLKILLEKIKDNKIITNELFEDYDIDAVLDLRDEKIFDLEWCRVYDKIKNIDIKKEDLTIINDIRKNIYLKVYDITEECEIAGYISDDFELISKAYISGINDCWLNMVITLYANNIIPFGKLEKSKSDINKVFNTLINK
nr:hypothetical protein [uncultured Tyzzerella sp.]